MQQACTQLPDKPVSIETFYDLMRPPRQGIGTTSPLLMTTEKTPQVAAGHLEVDGEMGAIAFEGDGWSQIGNTEPDTDSFYHEKGEYETWVDNWLEIARETVPQECHTPRHEIKRQSPPGFWVKTCIRDQPLSQKQFHEFEAFEQIADVLAINGVDNDKIISVLATENRPEGTPNAVAVYYHPELETWRIVDTVPMVLLDDAIEQLYRDTLTQVKKYYHNIDQISHFR